MKTYKQLFSNSDTTALIPFFVIGDPDFDTSLEIVKTVLDAGADALELGIPFSDPIADGPTIQKADIRALDAGMTTAKAIDFIKQITDYKPVPIGLLVYYNLIYQYGTERFLADFASAGGSGVLVADLSIDDADEIAIPAANVNLETIFMATPITPDERLETITQKTTGFIYTVSLLGVTGARSSLSNAVNPLIKKLKKLTDTSVCVGFGISTPAHAAQVAEAGADGVIIGSRIVKIIEENLNNKEKIKKDISNFITEVKSTLK